MASRDDDLDELLGDLETTLGALRRELQERERPTRRRGFEPPTPSDVLRFTDEYTIPTVIAVLEANIRALELLQRLLRVADPGRTTREGAAETRARLDDVGRTARSGMERALSDLRTALSEADLPPDSESRTIVEDARELAEEIERRLAETTPDRRRQSVDRSTGRREMDRAITIEVFDEDEKRDADERSDNAAEETTVNVDAELDSIKREVRGEDTSDEDDTDSDPRSDEADS
ncbi:MAG: DUF7547 family protein [Halobacteriota archaeon]